MNLHCQLIYSAKKRKKEAYRTLYQQWLPASGYQHADAPPFEIYINNPRNTAEEDLITDIYLPLDSK